MYLNNNNGKNSYEDLEDKELIKVAENIIDEAKMLFFLE